MAINKESNIYTIIFATIMVVVVGGLLAFVSTALKDAKQANVQNEKKQNIIQATGFMEKDKVIRDESSALFDKYVTRRLTIDFNGKVLFDSKGELAEGKQEIDSKNPMDAFNIEPRRQFRTADKEKLFPIFVCENEGKLVYVVSCSGKGLWDDVWGYIGLGADGNTVIAAKFDHKGETAGLGSVINEPKFQNQFNEDQGKTLADATGQFKGIEVIKPGSRPLDANSVDGLSGATFTGSGVKDMLVVYLEVYYNYFTKNKI